MNPNDKRVTFAAGTKRQSETSPAQLRRELEEDKEEQHIVLLSPVQERPRYIEVRDIKELSQNLFKVSSPSAAQNKLKQMRQISIKDYLEKPVVPRRLDPHLEATIEEDALLCGINVEDMRIIRESVVPNNLPLDYDSLLAEAKHRERIAKHQAVQKGNYMRPIPTLRPYDQYTLVQHHLVHGHTGLEVDGQINFIMFSKDTRVKSFSGHFTTKQLFGIIAEHMCPWMPAPSLIPQRTMCSQMLIYNSLRGPFFEINYAGGVVQSAFKVLDGARLDRQPQQKDQTSIEYKSFDGRNKVEACSPCEELKMKVSQGDVLQWIRDQHTNKCGPWGTKVMIFECSNWPF